MGSRQKRSRKAMRSPTLMYLCHFYFAFAYQALYYIAFSVHNSFNWSHPGHVTMLNLFLIAVGYQWLKDVDHKWGRG